MDDNFKHSKSTKLKIVPQIPIKKGIKFGMKLSSLPETVNLLGFSGNSMVFEKNQMEIVDESSQEKQGKKELILQKVQTDTNGKKFILLHGRKFQIIKPDKTILQNALTSKVNSSMESKSPKENCNSANVQISVKSSPQSTIVESKPVIDNTPNIETTDINTTSTDETIKVGSQSVESTPVVKLEKSQKISEGTQQSVIKLVDSKGSIILNPSAKTCLPMKGMIKLSNSSGTESRMIPLKHEFKPKLVAKNDSDSSQFKIMTNLLFVNSNKVENGLCSKCMNKIDEKKTTTSSMNTERIVSRDRAIQTENAFDVMVDTWNECLNDNTNTDDFIIGSNVNMGNGIKSIDSTDKAVTKDENAKMEFFKDLQMCLVWDSGNLLIHKGVIQKDLATVKRQCVVLKVRGAGVNIVNSNNYTPLQLAVIHNVHVEIVRVLLEYKADMSILDPEGNNVLHLAVENNRNDLVEMFLDNIMNSKLNINQLNYDGLTPLMCCAFHVDRIDMAELLLKKGAELNLRDLKSGRTAIFHAAENHNTPMVSLLLDYSADTKIRNFFGTSVHDAMFELDDIPREIKYPILGRDLKLHQKRKLNQQDGKRLQDQLKRKKFEIVPTFQKILTNTKFVVHRGQN